jgi:hypothetical protein
MPLCFPHTTKASFSVSITSKSVLKSIQISFMDWDKGFNLISEKPQANGPFLTGTDLNKSTMELEDKLMDSILFIS